MLARAVPCSPSLSHSSSLIFSLRLPNTFPFPRTTQWPVYFSLYSCVLKWLARFQGFHLHLYFEDYLCLFLVFCEYFEGPAVFFGIIVYYISLDSVFVCFQMHTLLSNQPHRARDTEPFPCLDWEDMPLLIHLWPDSPVSAGFWVQPALRCILCTACICPSIINPGHYPVRSSPRPDISNWIAFQTQHTN